MILSRDRMDSLASRFVDELPSDFVEKNNLNDQNFIQEDDFEFNQDFGDDEYRSPGWLNIKKN